MRNNNNDSIQTTTVVASPTPAPEAAVESEAPSATEAPETNNTEGGTEDFTVYTTFLTEQNDIFSKFIMSASNNTKFTVLKNALTDAINQKNVQSCDYNKQQIEQLKTSLENASIKSINKLKAKIKKLSKKSKKTTDYKEKMSLAKNSMAVKDYRNAQVYYTSAVSILKKTPKKKKKKVAKTNDDLYKQYFNSTQVYQEVYYSRLSPAAVASMNKETKRYYMNTLFAAYGYRFNNPTIQNHFSNQSWYSPDYSIAVGNQDAIKRNFDATCTYNYNLLK